MYTNRKDIYKLSEEFLNGVSLLDIIYQTRVSRENKNEIIEAVVLEGEKQGITLIDVDNVSVTYDMLFKAVKVYRRKCYELAGVLRQLAEGEQINSVVLEYFDLDVKKSKVLTRDFKRLLVPLKKNYELLQEALCKVKDVELYSKLDEKLLKGKKKPRASLMKDSQHRSDEFVDLTQGNIERIIERRTKIKERIYSEMHNKD